MNKITFKKLTRDNIQDILELEKLNAPDKPIYFRYDTEALSFIFNNPIICTALGAFDKKKLVGWASFRSNWNSENSIDNTYEMSSMVIDKKYRRRGLGLKLFNKRLQLISKLNPKEIYATASPLNIPILLLYLNNGFIIYNYKKDYYGSGVDRLFLKYAQ